MLRSRADRLDVCLLYSLLFLSDMKEKWKWVGNSYSLIFCDVSLLMETARLQQDDRCRLRLSEKSSSCPTHLPEFVCFLDSFGHWYCMTPTPPPAPALQGFSSSRLRLRPHPPPLCAWAGDKEKVRGEKTPSGTDYSSGDRRGYQMWWRCFWCVCAEKHKKRIFLSKSESAVINKVNIRPTTNLF